jgi:SAM-dependent methyltransferase
MSPLNPPSEGAIMATAGLEKVRADFDRIAALLESRAETAEAYEKYLLEQVPRDCASALDVGCGAGRMARLLASKSSHVVGIDASPNMINLARVRSADNSRIDFICADFMTHAFAGRFDCVMSMTTWHHLPLAGALERMKSLVKPSGTLIIHDVRRLSGASDWISSGVRTAATGKAWFWARRQLGQRGELAHAWREHGAGEQYLRMPEVRAYCAACLPGAHTVNHALFRFTIVWHNRS